MLAHTDFTFVCPVSFRHRGSPLAIPRDRRVEVIYTDLRGELPDMGPFAFMLNLASESHVDRSIADPIGVIENNISSTLQVLNYARLHRPWAFIQFSSDEVWGPGEWGTYAPSSPYAASKAAQEMVAMAYRRTYQVPVIITNANNLVGPGQNPEKYLPKLVKQIRAGERVQIHAVSGKPGRRHYTPVLNAADALVAIMGEHVDILREDIETQGPVPRFALSGGVELDNFEVASMVADLMGKPLSWETVEAETVRPGYDAAYSTHTDQRLADLGWRPVQTLAECLQEMIANG
jgi:dTDP-glucose 4,6-dehydratase